MTHHDTKPAFRLVFVGDFCPLNEVEAAFLSGRGRQALGAAVPLFEGADAVVANLETPLCEEGAPIVKCGPAFQVSPSAAKRFAECGLSAFVMANNHIMDQGIEGLRRTLAALDEAGILHTGAALTHEDACAPIVLERGGKRLAILNFAEGEFARAIGGGPGAARLDPWESPERVRQARAECDFVAAVLHTGNEYQPIPSPATVAAFRGMARAGAHAVIGHHAHIPQAWEVWNGAPICYGLGNFLFGKASPRPSWRLAEAAVLEFSAAGATLTVYPLRQEGEGILEALSSPDRKVFEEYAARCLQVISDPDLHRRVWEQEARGLFREQWPTWRKRLSLVETDREPPSLRRRLRRALRPPRKTDLQDAAALYYSVFNCDAHREMLRTAARLVHEGRLASDDAEAQAILADLLRRIAAAAGAA